MLANHFSGLALGCSEVDRRNAIQDGGEASVVARVIVPENVCAELRVEVEVLIAVHVPNLTTEASRKVELNVLQWHP